jgi:hypothetical protein
VTSSPDQALPNNGGQLVTGMTNNAGKGNLKPNSLARQMIRTAGKRQ